jgi:hypothetical protein
MIFFEKNIKFLFILHLILGVGSSFFKIPLIITGYVIFVVGANEILKSKGKSLPIYLAYFASFEVLSRLIGTSPYIPYESGKYIAIILGLLALSVKSKNNTSKLGLFFLLLALPSLLFVDFDNSFTEGVVFNFFGYIVLTILIFNFDGIKIDQQLIKQLLLALLLPAISLLLNIIVISPDIDKIDFQLGANFESSGNFGPNQISTYFGLAFFFMIFYNIYFGKIRFSILKLNDTIIFSLLFLYRGLLTFSRGGIVTAFLLLIFLYFFKPKQLANKFSINNKWYNSVFIVGFILFMLFYVNMKTDNKFLERYQGETTKSIQGTEEKDINSISSNRFLIFEEELGLFKSNPVFGVGPGKSRFERINLGLDDSNSHTEVGRMIAEHGSFGILMALVFLLYPLYRFFNSNSAFDKVLSVSFLSFAVLASFHSATRMLVIPFFYSLGTAKFNFNK